MSGIVIAGYSDVGFRCTRWLLDQGEPIRAIFTHPDTPGEERWWESLADLARARKVPVKLVESLDDPKDAEIIASLAPEFLFSFYFRKMIPERILKIPSRGALNMHGSLLPHFRGRAPINWAVIKGATETGASLHYMTPKPDAGDLVDQQGFPIGPDDMAITVARRVGEAAAIVLARAWPRLKSGTAPRIPLDLTQGSYFGGRKPSDGQIDWSLSSREVHNLVRGVSKPWPGAFTDIFGPKVIIWKTHLSPYGGHDSFPGKVEATENSVIVYCGDDRPVEILVARPEGKPDLDAGSFRGWLLEGAGH